MSHESSTRETVFLIIRRFKEYNWRDGYVVSTSADDVYEISRASTGAGSCYVSVVFANKWSVISRTSRRDLDESTLRGSGSRVLCPRASLLLNVNAGRAAAASAILSLAASILCGQSAV